MCGRDGFIKTSKKRSKGILASVVEWFGPRSVGQSVLGLNPGGDSFFFFLSLFIFFFLLFSLPTFSTVESFGPMQ